jgi:hypothetical protein
MRPLDANPSHAPDDDEKTVKKRPETDIKPTTNQPETDRKPTKINTIPTQNRRVPPAAGPDAGPIRYSPSRSAYLIVKELGPPELGSFEAKLNTKNRWCDRLSEIERELARP